MRIVALSVPLISAHLLPRAGDRHSISCDIQWKSSEPHFACIGYLCSIVLSANRTCIVHTDWVTIVICTKEHTIYNILLQEMHKYFPKSPIIRRSEYVAESDDKSDYSSEDKYFVPHELPLEQDVNEIECSRGDVSSSVSRSEDDHHDVPRYNLRSHGRRPSTRLMYVCNVQVCYSPKI